MPDGILWVDRSLFHKVASLPPVIDRMVGNVMYFEAQNAQNRMRSEAPWTDRTANARQGLFARSGKAEGRYYIVLYHTVPYGIWLEIKNSGRYAIIEPSLQPTGHEVMLSLRSLFRTAERAA